MSDEVLRIGVPFLVFVLAVYGFGLRPSGRVPFLRLAAPSRIFAWVVHGAARSRLRKTETLRDWFVYRERRVPGPEDLAGIQLMFIVSFGVILVVSLIAT